MKLAVQVLKKETSPIPLSDGEMVETLRAAAALLGPTGTRTALVRLAARHLTGVSAGRTSPTAFPEGGVQEPAQPGVEPPRDDTCPQRPEEQLLKHVQHLKALGDLSGPSGRPAVSPAPLRALLLVSPDAPALRYLLVGGPATVDLGLPARVETPYLRVARLMPDHRDAFEARVGALGGLVLPWTAWAGPRPARLDGAFLAQRGKGLQARAEPLPSEDLRLCRPGEAPPPAMTRWTRPRKADSGWFLARSGRQFWWVDVTSGQASRGTPIPWWEAAPLQFALERVAGAPRLVAVDPLEGDDALLTVPAPLPREEWRLVRALSSIAGPGGREWRLPLQDALWVAEILEGRLGVARTAS